MRIQIAKRLKPFSHKPGILCVLPGSTYAFQIYPTLIRCYDLQTSEKTLVTDIHLALTGIVKDFTVQLNLEKGEIGVWGQYKEGYVSYLLNAIPQTDSFAMTLECCPEGGMQWSHLDQIAEKDKTFLYTQSGFVEQPVAFFKPDKTERLSLGSHKKLDWSLVERRFDLVDILPVIFKLGQLIPEVVQTSGGTQELLDIFREAIEQKEKLAVCQTLTNFIAASFDGILTPRLKDTDFHGFHLSKNFKGSPLSLLKESARLIRNLFVTVKDSKIEILPVLPPEFHCGRLLDVSCGNLGQIDLEWTKKSIRQMIFRASEDGEIFFEYPSKIKGYRLKMDNSRKIISDFSKPITVSKGSTYYFDNFQK